MSEFLIELTTYHQKLLPALFATGFTVGSFLFSMKSSIIKTVREDVFDDEKYQQEMCEKIALGQAAGFYCNLQNFSSLLMKAIAWSFISALSQVVFGVFEKPCTTIICFAIAFVSWFYLARAIYHVQNNMRVAIEYKEEMKKLEKESEIEKCKKALSD